jgi:hypothetical protein
MHNKPFFILLALLCAVTLSVKAQEGEQEFFVYDGGDTTIITGLTTVGTGSEELTIPDYVTLVKPHAFDGNTAGLNLVVIDGGNPVFELDEDGLNALSDVRTTLTILDLCDGMTIENIKYLINGIGTTNNLETIVIDQCKTDDSSPTTISDIQWTEEEVNLSSNCHVMLPAELVEDQEFGAAKVYGYFNYTHSLSTFCGKVPFYDEDNGSHWLFYVPTEIHVDNKEVSFQRVRYVMDEEGVLIHSLESSSKYVGLPRLDDVPLYYSDQNTYSKNKLVGVTDNTTIGKTSEDGTKTNLILYEGKFYPTTGGLFPCNRAYLQVDTDQYNQMKNKNGNAALSLVFDDDEDGIHQVGSEKTDELRNGWFTLGGQRIESPSKSGIYIHDGRLEIVK